MKHTVTNEKRDSLGRERHPNQSNGAKTMPAAGIGEGGESLVCPDHLGDKGREVWEGMKERLMKKDLLDEHDAEALDLFAAAYEDWWNARADVKKNGLTIKYEGAKGMVIKTNPAVNVASNCWRDLKSMLSELGIGPSARTKLHCAETGGDLLLEVLSGKKVL